MSFEQMTVDCLFRFENLCAKRISDVLGVDKYPKYIFLKNRCLAKLNKKSSKVVDCP